jgi:hypothetical protein
MIADSAAIGFLCFIMRLMTSTMTMLRDSPTSSRMQMVLSESMVVFRKLMLSGLIPRAGSCTHNSRASCTTLTRSVRRAVRRPVTAARRARSQKN